MTTSGGEERGRDNARDVDGRKRHIVLNSVGLLLVMLVTAADLDDVKAAADLFARIYGDTKYHNCEWYECIEANVRWERKIISRPKGFKVWVTLPIRWTVERILACKRHR